MKKFVIIDGNNTMHRMYYAYMSLFSKINGKEIKTGMLYGVIKNLIYLKDKYPESEIIYTFDSIGKKVKNGMFGEYKTNRKGKEDDFIESYKTTMTALTLLGYKLAYAKGYEADDVIYTIVKRKHKQYKEKDIKSKFIVVSSDHDLYQVIKSYCYMMPNKKKDEDKLITPRIFRETYGIDSNLYLQVMALTGCKGDNVPGIKGIGETIALRLIKEYYTVDNIYNNINKIKGTLKEKLEYGKSIAYRNLVLLKPLTIPKEKLVYEQYEAELKTLKKVFKKLNFKQFLVESNWNKIKDIAVK